MRLSKLKQTTVLIITLSALIFVSGCKSKQTAINTGGALEKKSQNELISDVLNSELKYKTLSTKGSLEFKKGSSGKKVTTVFKIVKDSIIQASVRPLLGVEAMRISFTPDSILIIDRLKKQYVSESFESSEMIKNLDFNYSNLQALFTNQLFVPGSKTVSKSDYKKFNLSTTPDAYLLQTKDKGELLYNFAVDASNRIASTSVYNERKNFTVQWSYSDFVTDGKNIYPTSMVAKVDVSKKRFDVGINYTKLDIDKDMNIDNSIPSKYTKVSFMDLMSSYIK